MKGKRSIPTAGRAAIAVLCALVAMLAFLLWPVECPYCHDSDANIKGDCVQLRRTGHCPEDYYPVHFNKSTCPWCRGYGRMGRLVARLD